MDSLTYTVATSFCFHFPIDCNNRDGILGNPHGWQIRLNSDSFCSACALVLRIPLRILSSGSIWDDGVKHQPSVSETKWLCHYLWGYFSSVSTHLRGCIALVCPSPPETDPQISEHADWLVRWITPSNGPLLTRNLVCRIVPFERVHCAIWSQNFCALP